MAAGTSVIFVLIRIKIVLTFKLTLVFGNQHSTIRLIMSRKLSSSAPLLFFSS